jgi:hypothetical protein
MESIFLSGLAGSHKPKRREWKQRTLNTEQLDDINQQMKDAEEVPRFLKTLVSSFFMQ